MLASEWYKRQKDKLKRALRSDSRSTLASIRSNTSTSPGPVPPLAADSATKGLGLGSTDPQPNIEPASQQHIEAGMTLSLPNPTEHVQAPTADITATATPKSLPENLTKPKAQEKKWEWLGLKALLGMLNSAADIVGPLKSAVEGLEGSIGIFERASKARDNYQELGEKLDQLLGDLAQFKNGRMNEAMTTSVKHLCKRIEVELKIVETKQARGGPEQYMEAVEDSDTILECYRRIHGYVERLILNANLSMWKTVDEEMTDRRLLQLSPGMSGAYNSWVSDRAKRRECTGGTRVPELKKLKDWASNPSKNPIYWINGLAGTGKTTIAYTLCAELDTANELAASFFCTRQFPECRNIQLIIPAIACQMAQFSYPFRHALSRALESDQLAGTRALETQFRTLISNPLKAVRAALPPSFVVVIDALDECEDTDGIGKILDLLITSTSDLPVRFLLSSRPEPEIYRRMANQVGSLPDAKLVLHEIEPANVKKDIAAYLRDELREISLTDAQWAGLLERCCLLFIYASTACRYIKSGDEMMNYKESINTILGLSFEATGDMEKALDKLYTTILTTAFDRPHISDANKKRMKTILDTIICAQEPMTTETLAVLLGLNNADHARTLLLPLFSVVNVAEETGIATTLHESFPDFMLSSGRSASFHCAATQHHPTLTRACLRQIKSNPVQFNICNLESSHVFDNDIADILERAQRAVSPALFYACSHWGAHLELGGPLKDLTDLVIDFLSVRFLLWMEVVSVKQRIWEGVSLMGQVEKWCREAHAPMEFVELAHDAQSFVELYATHPVRKSTPHIYTSMLPFWPIDSPIAKHYIPRTTGMPQPKGSAIDGRYLPRIAYRYLGETMRVIVYFPDGSKIAVAVGNDIYILDGRTGKAIIEPLKGHTDLVTSIAISPDGLNLATGSYDATIRVWNIKDRKLVIEPIKAHRDKVTSVTFSPDGTRIASTGVNEPFRVWSVQSGQQLLTGSSTSDHSDYLRTVVYTPDGSHLISGGHNGTICSWDAHTGNLISEQHREHSGSINSVTLSLNGSWIISASSDGTVHVWDVTNHRMVFKSLRGHFEGANQALLSPDNRYIASCDENGMIHLWDAGSGDFVTSLFEGHAGAVKSVAFSPGDSCLASCSEDGTLCIWNIRHLENTWDGRGGRMVEDFLPSIRSIRFSNDSSQIVGGGEDGGIRLWDTNTGELVVGPLTGHQGYICSVTISPDGAYIASASSDKTIRLWDLKGERGACTVLEHHTKRPDTLEFSSDSSRIFYGSLVYSVKSSPASDITPTQQNNARDEWAAAIPTDSVNRDHTLAIRNSSYDNRDARFTTFAAWGGNFLPVRPHSAYNFTTYCKNHLNGISCVTHSPDGLYIASASANGTVRILHAKTGRLLIGPVSVHSDPITTIMFSPDGTRLAICSPHAIRFWPIPTNSTGKIGHTYSSDALQGTSITASPIARWMLRKDGWIVNDRSELLVWVPPDLRPYLLLPDNDLLISHQGSFKLDFTDTNIGKLWTRSFNHL